MSMKHEAQSTAARSGVHAGNAISLGSFFHHVSGVEANGTRHGMLLASVRDAAGL